MGQFEKAINQKWQHSIQRRTTYVHAAIESGALSEKLLLFFVRQNREKSQYKRNGIQFTWICWHCMLGRLASNFFDVQVYAVHAQNAQKVGREEREEKKNICYCFVLYFGAHGYRVWVCTCAKRNRHDWTLYVYANKRTTVESSTNFYLNRFVELISMRLAINQIHRVFVKCDNPRKSIEGYSMHRTISHTWRLPRNTRNEKKTMVFVCLPLKRDGESREREREREKKTYHSFTIRNQWCMEWTKLGWWQDTVCKFNYYSLVSSRSHILYR